VATRATRRRTCTERGHLIAYMPVGFTRGQSEPDHGKWGERGEGGEKTDWNSCHLFYFFSRSITCQCGAAVNTSSRQKVLWSAKMSSSSLFICMSVSCASFRFIRAGQAEDRGWVIKVERSVERAQPQWCPKVLWWYRRRRGVHWLVNSHARHQGISQWGLGGRRPAADACIQRSCQSMPKYTVYCIDSIQTIYWYR